MLQGPPGSGHVLVAWLWPRAAGGWGGPEEQPESQPLSAVLYSHLLLVIACLLLVLGNPYLCQPVGTALIPGCAATRGKEQHGSSCSTSGFLRCKAGPVHNLFSSLLWVNKDSTMPRGSRARPMTPRPSPEHRGSRRTQASGTDRHRRKKAEK